MCAMSTPSRAPCLYDQKSITCCRFFLFLFDIANKEKKKSELLLVQSWTVWQTFVIITNHWLCCPFNRRPLRVHLKALMAGIKKDIHRVTSVPMLKENCVAVSNSVCCPSLYSLRGIRDKLACPGEWLRLMNCMTFRDSCKKKERTRKEVAPRVS